MTQAQPDETTDYSRLLGVFAAFDPQAVDTTPSIATPWDEPEPRIKLAQRVAFIFTRDGRIGAYMALKGESVTLQPTSSSIASSASGYQTLRGVLSGFSEQDVRNDPNAPGGPQLSCRAARRSAFCPTAASASTAIWPTTKMCSSGPAWLLRWRRKRRLKRLPLQRKKPRPRGCAFPIPARTNSAIGPSSSPRPPRPGRTNARPAEARGGAVPSRGTGRIFRPAGGAPHPYRTVALSSRCIHFVRGYNLRRCFPRRSVAMHVIPHLNLAWLLRPSQRPSPFGARGAAAKAALLSCCAAPLLFCALPGLSQPRGHAEHGRAPGAGLLAHRPARELQLRHRRFRRRPATRPGHGGNRALRFTFHALPDPPSAHGWPRTIRAVRTIHWSHRSFRPAADLRDRREWRSCSGPGPHRRRATAAHRHSAERWPRQVLAG